MADRDSLIFLYFSLGFSAKEILATLAFKNEYVISERHLRRLLKLLNLRCRKNFDDIYDVVTFNEMRSNTWANYMVIGSCI